MAITTHLDIVSAEKSVFSGVVERISVTTVLGEMGVEPGHAPLLAMLKPGDVRVVYPGGQEEIFYVSGGLLEVQPYVISVLADEVIRADVLDEEAALASKEQAEALLREKSDLDYAKAAAELARAAAQIRAIRKARKKKA